MDNQARELVAIGASVAAGCQPCLTYHLNKAHRYEVDPKDIDEAIALARMVRRGARARMDEFIDKETRREVEEDGAEFGRSPGVNCCG